MITTVGKVNVQAIVLKLIIAVVFIVNVLIFGFLIADARCTTTNDKVLCSKKCEQKQGTSTIETPSAFYLKASQQVIAVLRAIDRIF